MAKKKIPTSKPKTVDLSDFVNDGIDNEEPKVVKPAKEKKQRYNFTFTPSFIDGIDKYLEENPHEGSSRSAFLSRCVIMYMNDIKNK
jgi:hypothetical protein